MLAEGQLGHTGAIDGRLGPASWKAYQRFLKAHWGYTGAIDGDPGPATQAAFKRDTDALAGFC